MNRNQKIAILVGLVLLCTIALFPPREFYTSKFDHPRKFLFSRSIDIHSFVDSHDGLDQKTEQYSQVDVGRLLAEILLVASLVGISVVMLGTKEHLA